MMATIISSNGRITIDKAGNIIKASLESDGGCNIVRFDMGEYRRTYGPDTPSYIDILDIGYWYRRGELVCYEPASDDWRLIFTSSKA